MDYKAKYAAQQQVIKDNYKTFNVPYNGTDNDNYADGEQDFRWVVQHEFERHGWRVEAVCLGNPMRHDEKYLLINQGLSPIRSKLLRGRYPLHRLRPRSRERLDRAKNFPSAIPSSLQPQVSSELFSYYVKLAEKR